jgi:hypothetical protein
MLQAIQNVIVFLSLIAAITIATVVVVLVTRSLIIGAIGGFYLLLSVLSGSAYGLR